MDNQHRKISGYRELSHVEVELMNKIKQHGVETEALIARVNAHLNAQYEATKVYLPMEEEERRMKATLKEGETLDIPSGLMPTDEAQAERERLMQALPHRWVAIATTNFQTAGMALTRAIAQPTTF